MVLNSTNQASQSAHNALQAAKSLVVGLASGVKCFTNVILSPEQLLFIANPVNNNDVFCIPFDDGYDCFCKSNVCLGFTCSMIACSAVDPLTNPNPYCLFGR